MNSFLLNSRRAFRKSGGSGVSTWTFDLASLEYMRKSQVIDIDAVIQWIPTPDGKLVMLPAYEGGYSYVRKRGYMTTDPGYDPLHPLDLPYIGLTSSTDGYYQGQNNINYWGNATPTETTAMCLGMTLAPDGKRIFLMLRAMRNSVTGAFFASIDLDEAWTFEPELIPMSNIYGNQTVLPSWVRGIDWGSMTCVLQGGATRQFAMSTVGLPDTVFNKTVMRVAHNGSRMYTLGGRYVATGADAITQYSMADPFDVTTMKRSNTVLSLNSYAVDFGGSSTMYRDIVMSPDGLRLFVLGLNINTTYDPRNNSSNNSYIYEFGLSVPYDIGTAEPVKRVRLQDTAVGLYDYAPTIAPTGMFIDEQNGGERIFLYDSRVRTLYQFSVTSPS